MICTDKDESTAGAQVFPGIGPWEETKMPRDVTTLKIWIRAAARSEARHLVVMQAGVRRAGDPSVLKRATKAGTSPLSPRPPVTDTCDTAS